MASSVTEAAWRNKIEPPEVWAAGRPAVITTVQRTVAKMGVTRTAHVLAVINQPAGFDCPGCGWPKAPPGKRHRIEFCESGAKAVAKTAPARIDARLFARHSLDDLRSRSDYWRAKPVV